MAQWLALIAQLDPAPAILLGEAEFPAWHHAVTPRCPILADLPLEQVIAQLANSCLFIGHDSGIGHLAAAYCVVTGEADTCLATRSAAQTFNLDFVPLHSERYDLVMRRRTADLPAIKAFLDVLQRATLRRKLEVLAGYDTSQTGSVLLY